MNTAAAEETATTIKLLSKYASTTATTTPPIAAQKFEAPLKNTSGKAIDVSTAQGIYAKNDCIN